MSSGVKRVGDVSIGDRVAVSPPSSSYLSLFL